MVERLTEWSYLAGVMTGDLKAGVDERKAFDRLAAYEDTGLEPEEIKEGIEVGKELFFERADLYAELGPIDHLLELAQAEKDGRLVVLPCKPGTEIFTHCHVRNANPIAHSYFYPPYIPTLGENAWLTHEEAEAALKKREETDNEESNSNRL